MAIQIAAAATLEQHSDSHSNTAVATTTTRVSSLLQSQFSLVLSTDEARMLSRVFPGDT